MPLLPVYAKVLGASGWVIGLLLSSFSAMQFLFAPLWGRLSDRIGRRPVLLVGLAGSVIFYALFGYASNLGLLTWMFLARIGAGISGATIATAQAFIADSTPPEKRTAGMAIVGAAFGAGFVFGPILGALCLWLAPPSAETGITGLPGYLAAAFSMVALVLAIAILPESLQKGSRSAHRGWLGLSDLSRATSVPGVTSLLFVFFLATFAFAKFESTIALFGQKVFQLNLGENFLLYAYFGFILVLAQGGVRSLAKRLAPQSIGLMGTVLLLAGMVGLVASAHYSSKGYLYLAAVVLVTGFAFLTTSSQSLLSTRSRADEQGGILGLNQSFSALARILGPLLGNIAFSVQPTLPYAISAILMVVVIVLYLRLPRWDNPQP
ncbi:MFS transporter [bacterium]|nr:MFS transporter [bacterium]